MPKTVHIIGAGISGLSAAVRLIDQGYKVHVHEATQQAGGRCRSYFDAQTNLTIDNGNHLLLSGNRHALAYARSIGSEAGLVGPKIAQFPFVDIATRQRWLLDLGDSRWPLWVLGVGRWRRREAGWPSCQCSWPSAAGCWRSSPSLFPPGR